jgi:hypothetical protein
MAQSDLIMEPPPGAPPESTPAPEKLDTGLGPMTTKSKFGDKFRAEFERLTTDAPTKEAPPPAEVPDQPKTEEVPETKSVEEKKVDPKTEVKPESPLDVLTEKPKEEKPVEEYDFDKVEKPKSSDWQKARETMKALKQEVSELKSAPKPTATEDVVWKTKAQELEQALQERETTIKSLNAEYSQDYQKLVGKYQGTAEKIKTRMDSFGADGNSLLAALALPFSKVRTDQIDAVLAELPAGKQGRIESLIEELEGHGEAIGEFRKDLPKKYDEMAAAYQQQVAENQVNAIKQLESEFVKITEKIPDSIVTMREVADDVPGGTEWNKEIKEARENALRVLKPDGADFNESVQVALKGARYDTLEKRYLNLHKDYSELKKRMAEYDGAGPDFKGGSKPKGSAPKSAPQKYREAMEAIGRGQLTDV